MLCGPDKSQKAPPAVVVGRQGVSEQAALLSERSGLGAHDSLTSRLLFTYAHGGVTVDIYMCEAGKILCTI